MKWIVLALLFSSANVLGQSTETDIPVLRKSNRVVMHYSDTSGLYKKILINLVDRGYVIDTKDLESGLITTKTAPMPGGYAFPVTLKFILRDSTIQLSGKLPSVDLDIFYVKPKPRTIVVEAWKELITISDLLKPDRITYLESKQ